MAATSLRSVAVAVDVFLPAPPPRKPTSPSLSFHPLLSAKPRPLPLRLRSTRRLPLPPLAASNDEAVQGFGRALRLGQTDDEAVLDPEGEGLQEAVGVHGEPPEEANVFVGNLPLDVDSERRAGAAALGWGEPDADEAVLDPEGEGLQAAVGRFVEPPEEVKVFVGNLPYDVDSERLAQLFDQAGVVEVAEVIYNRETGQSRGFGFVTMSSVEEADKAVEMLSRYEISGRLLTVNKAAPRGSRAEGPPPPRQFGPSFRAYVGNLPWQVDDSRLMQLFSEHGEVVDARVVYDRETGRSRGFGFVRMASKEELNGAITALDGQSLDGRELRVNVAEERPRRGF